MQTNADFEDDRYFKGDWPQKRFRRRTRINFLGMSAFLIYVVALIFYIWVRLLWPLHAAVLVPFASSQSPRIICLHHGIFQPIPLTECI